MHSPLGVPPVGPRGSDLRNLLIFPKKNAKGACSQRLDHPFQTQNSGCKQQLEVTE